MAWPHEFQRFLDTPYEQGGSGRFFKLPIENKDIFWHLFDQFQTRWPEGIVMRERGLFMVDITQKRMLFSRIRAVFIADKWAPYVVNYPRYEKW